jgi:thiamine biosynthesis lipoprotein
VLKWNSAALVLLAGSAVAAQRYEFAEPVMGTLARITVYASSSQDARAAADAAFFRMRELDAIMSDYRDDSELMQLCRRPPGTPVAVSNDLFVVLEHAQRLAAETGGAFDVTIGPVVRLWRQARRERRLPSPRELDEVRHRTGYRHLHLDAQARTVTLKAAGMLLDLGGIAKGYAADAALAVLRNRRLPRSLVAIGGDIAAGDPPPGQPGWRVALAASGEVRTLHDVSVSTSGDTEQYVEIDGVRYSHIVDPRTGIGLRDQRTVTVIAQDGLTADSLATALSLPGVDPARFQTATIQVTVGQTSVCQVCQSVEERCSPNASTSPH